MRAILLPVLSTLLVLNIGIHVRPAMAEDTNPPAARMNDAAYGDWRSDAPGVRRKITADRLPAPYSTQSAGNGPGPAARPRGAVPKVPAGFTADLFATGMTNPRIVHVAPNGDIFVAETAAGRIHVFRAQDGSGKPSENKIFATGLNQPFGLAFYPSGPNPQYLYVANMNSVVRFAYQNGDLTARSTPTVIVPSLPTGGHTTRDVVFSPDGEHMYISVGSDSNVAEGMRGRDLSNAHSFEQSHALGAGWDSEEFRADVLDFTPTGDSKRIYATGIRNCVSMAIQPMTNDLWCATNERDGLGDNLPPDYVTRVARGQFFGWPWYYTGSHMDPRHRGERTDLDGRVTVADVLIQPHSAPLGMAFYTGTQFPASYRGDAFVALHGSWNRGQRTGYKVVRIPIRDGKPTGEYEDFMIGFVASDQGVWGRPVGVAVAHDGALLVTEDGGGTIWRISYKGN